MNPRAAHLLKFATTLPPARARAVVDAVVAASAERTNTTLAEFKARAAEAFAADMQPVCAALASALRADDLAALQGFKALLPGLLREVNRAPALADLLAIQLGAAVLEGMKEAAE